MRARRRRKKFCATLRLMKASNRQLEFWSAPAERSGDGALDSRRARTPRESKAVSHFACHRTPKQRRMSDWIKRFIPFASLIALCVIIAALEPRFLSSGNLASVARQTAVITVMAMGMTMVVVSGGLDLSVGS